MDVGVELTVPRGGRGLRRAKAAVVLRVYPNGQWLPRRSRPAPVTVQSFDGARPGLDPRADPRLVHRVEVLVFFSLLVPSYVLSFFASGSASAPFTLVATATVLRDLSLAGLVGFFLWRNGDRLSSIGWRRENVAREALLGLALFVPAAAAAAVLGVVLRHVGLTIPGNALTGLAPGGPAQAVLAVVLVFVVAIVEETIFRGYLLSRIREATRSTTAAVVVSTVLFAMGHGYEGVAGLILTAFLGLVFAFVLLWRGSLVAPATMHFCQDFLAIVLVPFLARGR